MDDERETFLLSIPDAINSSEYSSSSDDSDIEVASTFDEQENELIKISNDLRLDSDSDESADDNATVLPQSMTSTHFDVDVHSSEDDEIPVDGAMVDNASQSRITCTRLTWEAWRRTLKSIDLKKGFREIGYTWASDSIVTPRTLPGYIYNPDRDEDVRSDDDDNHRNRIANDATLASQENTQMKLNIGGKQLNLLDLWK